MGREIVCPRCRGTGKVISTLRCKHKEKEIYKWESSIAYIEDLRCKECLKVFERKVNKKS